MHGINTVQTTAEMEERNLGYRVVHCKYAGSNQARSLYAKTKNMCRLRSRRKKLVVFA